MAIKIVHYTDYKKETDKYIYINTTSRSELDWSKDFSPFYLGPCKLYGDFESKNVENAWQYCKVYKKYLDMFGGPNEEYFKWAQSGWTNKSAVRYPMGKNAKPEYSYWDGKCYSYIQARKKIYVPLYVKSVIKTNGFKKLKELYNSKIDIYLRDFDGYDHDSLNMSLTDVLNNPTKTMGHAFVLKMLLTGDECLLQCDL